MESAFEHCYREFVEYCQTLTNTQLANVLRDEQERHQNNPNDMIFAACYAAAKSESQRRGGS
jgi:hypothetical protein